MKEATLEIKDLNNLRKIIDSRTKIKENYNTSQIQKEIKKNIIGRDILVTEILERGSEVIIGNQEYNLKNKPDLERAKLDYWLYVYSENGNSINKDGKDLYVLFERV